MVKDSMLMQDWPAWRLLQIVQDQLITILETINAKLRSKLHKEIKILQQSANVMRTMKMNIVVGSQTWFNEAAWYPFDPVRAEVFSDESTIWGWVETPCTFNFCEYTIIHNKMKYTNIIHICPNRQKTNVTRRNFLIVNTCESEFRKWKAIHSM